MLINNAAMGRLPIPINEARPCRLWLISNTAAIASPIPDAIRKLKPTLPAVVFTSDQILKANIHELSAQKININDNTQL
jgi:hypothetical protein